MSSGSTVLPALGQTRCYWAILSPTLTFLALDPILYSHMGAQAESFIGTTVGEWTHEEERQALVGDLVEDKWEDFTTGRRMRGVEKSGGEGSVTTVRFLQLSKIRIALGCPNPETDPQKLLYTQDERYLALRLSTSWIAPGGVLGFFHAIGDKDHVKDNDPHLALPTGWTNFCGPHSLSTGYFPDGLIPALQSALHSLTPTHDGAFFILDEHRKIVVEVGLERFRRGGKGRDVEEEFEKMCKGVIERESAEFEAGGRVDGIPGTNCTRRVRSRHTLTLEGTGYDLSSILILYGDITFACFEFLSSSQPYIPSSSGFSSAPLQTPYLTQTSSIPILNYPANGNNYSTSRPYQSSLSPSLEPSPVSTDIPNLKRPVTEPSAADPLVKRQRKAALKPNAFVPPPSPGYLNSNNLSLNLSLNVNVDGSNTPGSAGLGPGGSSGGAMMFPGDISPTVASASAILGSFSGAQQQHHYPSNYSLPPHSHPYQPPPQYYSNSSSQSVTTNSHLNSTAYGPNSSHQDQPQHSYSPYAPQPPSSGYNPSQPSYGPTQAYNPYVPSSLSAYGSTASPYSSASSYSPLNPHFAPSSQPQQPHPQPQPQPQQSNLTTLPLPPLPSNQNQPRSLSPPPPTSVIPNKKAQSKHNNKACESCGTRDSPEWRKGPSGGKTLCNACGLRFARSVARSKNPAAPKEKKPNAKKAAATADELTDEGAGSPYSLDVAGE